MEKHSLTAQSGKKKSSFNFKRLVSKPRTTAVAQNVKNKKKSSATWLKRHFNDPLFEEKIKDGFVSRAAYKLMEIDNKFKLFHRPQTVIDLGASPGSWTQVAWNAIGSPKSKLIGIDLLQWHEKLSAKTKTDPIFFIKGDFTDHNNQEKIISLLENQKVDLILSDIAPNTTGSRSADHFALMEILNQELTFASKIMATNGNMVIKIFEGSETKDFALKMKGMFSKISFFKPLSSNKDSREIYIVALGKLPNNQRATDTTLLL